MGVDSFADVFEIGAHFQSQNRFMNQLTCVEAADPRSENPSRLPVENDFRVPPEASALRALPLAPQGNLPSL